MFPRDMVCLRNISVDTLHKGDTEDDDDDDDNNNNNIFVMSGTRLGLTKPFALMPSSTPEEISTGTVYTYCLY
jgi:hypothetical protein